MKNESLSKKYTVRGCSNTTNKKDVGCQPVAKPCNPFVLLQLSTSNKATQCYCDENGCNHPTILFKLIFGGYAIMIIGFIGIVGNILAFGVLFSLKKGNEVDIILTGN